MSVVLLGPGGMLGAAFVQDLAERQVVVECFASPEFDLTRARDIAALPLRDDTIVVNAAAYTDVDQAESDRDRAFAVNGTAVGELALRCRERGAKLLHFSTDYVFDGTASAPYRVDHPRRPLNVYGASKAAGELAIERSGCRHLIVRTSWLYAPWGKNFVRSIAAACRKQNGLRVVDDQRGRPTSAEHLATATWALHKCGAEGLVHVTDGGACTWFELAREIARTIRPQCTVTPCSSAEYPRPAPRPRYSVLDLTRAESLLGPMPRWQDELALVLKRVAIDPS